jgi:hypothetical protein
MIAVRGYSIALGTIPVGALSGAFHAIQSPFLLSFIGIWDTLKMLRVVYPVLDSTFSTHINLCIILNGQSSNTSSFDVIFGLIGSSNLQKNLRKAQFRHIVCAVTH